jgi:uncharacterized protein with HEPN domain
MPSDRVVEHLRHIHREIALAQQFVGPLSEEEFAADDMRLRAVVRCLEIISEASRRLPADLKARHPNLPWRDIAGSGNIYRHDYEDILAWRVWETARSLTELRQAIEQELAK